MSVGQHFFINITSIPCTEGDKVRLSYCMPRIALFSKKIVPTVAVAEIHGVISSLQLAAEEIHGVIYVPTSSNKERMAVVF